MTYRDHPRIDVARCTGCGRCVAACRKRLLTLQVTGFRKHALVVSSQSCKRCGGCASACPVHAITFEDPAGEPPDAD